MGGLLQQHCRFELLVHCLGNPKKASVSGYHQTDLLSYSENAEKDPTNNNGEIPVFFWSL